jgi:hypothetical protein
MEAQRKITHYREIFGRKNRETIQNSIYRRDTSIVVQSSNRTAQSRGRVNTVVCQKQLENEKNTV